jgi:hypothetical protein
MTPEQLRSRALRFESQTRRSHLLNQASFGLFVIIVAVALFVRSGGLLYYVGAAMMLIWAVYGMWGMHHFYAPLRLSPDANAGTCAAVYKRQLERQRDLFLSWPLGVGLVLPGAILVTIAGPFGSNHESSTWREAWTVPIAFVAILVFAYLAAITYGKIVAGRWQREIDELESMR